MSSRYQLHLITDRKRTRLPWEQALTAALAGGVDYVQLREKAAPAGETYQAARFLVGQARAAGAGVLVNDRVDVALAAGAAGAHLARKSLPPAAARPLLPPPLLLGCSVHSLAQARAAAAQGADYVTFGHVFPTASKRGLAPRGVHALAEVVAGVEVPVLAIGGIDLDNLGEVLQTGCAGIAVIGAILDRDDPQAAAQRLREALDQAPGQPRRPFPKGARSHAAHRER